jgi:DNA ligase (NAD+)|uniref:DNA ligase (NAD(+)) n=1 Tax=viral metagenome TaxID=1070528 RepID=A0A6C0JTT8_9ZZZZ
MDINNLLKDPINYLKTKNKKDIINFLQECDTAFFNTSSTLVSDDMYDLVKDYLKKLDPKNPYFKRVGADEETKVKLPFWMGSLDKIKDDEKAIDSWKNKYHGSSIISDKLDGISCLYYKNGNDIKIFTRGNGTEGQDISHLRNYITFPTITDNKFAVRGELIISRTNWEKIKDIGSNARNVVAGAIHSKIINKDLMSNIDFIAYDILSPKMKIEDVFNYFTKNNIKCANYVLWDLDNINLQSLSNHLELRRNESDYEVDGIVVYNNNIHKVINGKNPKYAFAFKSILTHEQAEVTVSDVEWNVSMHKYMKPIVKFNEVVIAGVKIKQATGFNGKFINSNIIGPGSRIVIIRSGDVIPHILKILSVSSNGKPKMPELKYKWNDTLIDIILDEDGKNKEQDIKSYTYFMAKLDVGSVKESTIKRLYENGFDTLEKILKIKVEELKQLDGFQEKSAIKIVENFAKIKDSHCDILLDASNILGRGFALKKIKLVSEKYPLNKKAEILKLTIDDLLKIDGIGNVNAKQFVENIKKFYEFLDKIGYKCNRVNIKGDIKDENKVEILKDKKFLFTGFRNKDWEKLITDSGGKVVTAISKTTDYLVVKNKTDKSSKIDKANELGVKILDMGEFEKMIG